MSLELVLVIINKLLPEPHASLLAGMLFGVKKTMPPDFYDALIETGMLHVIALSGMNISIIVRVLFDTLGKILGITISVMLTIAAIVGFITFVGASSTIVRAGIMGCLSLGGVLFGRRDIPLLSLAVAAGTMILLNPSIISSISFQLSCAATLGIILFGGGTYHTNPAEQQVKTSVSSLTEIGYSLLSFIRSELRVTFAAQLFTVPIIFYYFHRVSLISPIANVAIGFLVAPITIIGFVMVIAGVIWLPLGRLVAFALWPLLELFIVVIRLLSKVPMASVEFL